MGTSVDTLRSWLNDAKKEGATHMIVVCDTYDHDDYPVTVMPGEDAREKADEYRGKSMQRVMEVYNLSIDFEEQLIGGTRVWNY